jgi:hypothetical protein
LTQDQIRVTVPLASRKTSSVVLSMSERQAVGRASSLRKSTTRRWNTSPTTRRNLGCSNNAVSAILDMTLTPGRRPSQSTPRVTGKRSTAFRRVRRDLRAALTSRQRVVDAIVFTLSTTRLEAPYFAGAGAGG